jgi:hypothetical protein
VGCLSGYDLGLLCYLKDGMEVSWNTSRADDFDAKARACRSPYSNREEASP